MPLAKTDTRERAKIRLNEERRVKHAHAVLKELMLRHHIDERDIQELFTLMLRLTTAIQNQHIRDERGVKLKAKFQGLEGY